MLDRVGIAVSVGFQKGEFPVSHVTHVRRAIRFTITQFIAIKKYFCTDVFFFLFITFCSKYVDMNLKTSKSFSVISGQYVNLQTFVKKKKPTQTMKSLHH